MTPPAPPSPPRLPEWLLRGSAMLLRGAALVSLFWLAGRLERHLDGTTLRGLAMLAAGGAAAAFLAIGAGARHRQDITTSRTLDWLLFLPWCVLFLLALWLLRDGIATAPLRALAAAVLSTGAGVLLSLGGLLLRGALARPR